MQLFVNMRVGVVGGDGYDDGVGILLATTRCRLLQFDGKGEY